MQQRERFVIFELSPSKYLYQCTYGICLGLKYYKYIFYLILDTAGAIWDLEQVVVELESPLEDFQQVDTESSTAPRDAAIGHGGVITTTRRYKQN